MPFDVTTPAVFGLRQKLVAEFLGTTLLLCAVIGSGIMAQQLSGGNGAIALLVNTLATVFILYVLIETLAPISGAHFNPVVSLVILARGDMDSAKPAKAATLFVVV